MAQKISRREMEEQQMRVALNEAIAAENNNEKSAQIKKAEDAEDVKDLLEMWLDSFD